ncbi:MAG: hypothetical protein ACRC3Z_10545 [Phocaeicola sp.]
MNKGADIDLISMKYPKQKKLADFTNKKTEVKMNPIVNGVKVRRISEITNRTE